ncbi:hypothetical protein UG54_00760 [Gordonia sihwensis]|nr:hypothetical protein UG54_00760 [Gordonia sihwensis]
MNTMTALAADLTAADEELATAQTHRKNAKDSMIELATAHPLSRNDLEAAGLTTAEARKIHNDVNAVPRRWEKNDNYCIERVDAGSRKSGIVAVVPSSALALRGIELGLYLRAPRLKQPINDNIEYIATDTHQRLNIIRPVLARFTLGRDGAKGLPAKYAQQLNNYTNQVEVEWDGGADVIFLGPNIDLDIPLGFAGRGGVAGVRHVALEDLRSYGQLKGVPTTV